jgi:hypothetical protein
VGRAILLWLLGVPIPIIILLALFWRPRAAEPSSLCVAGAQSE